MIGHSLSKFPSQKKPSSKKGKQWRQQCVDAGENQVVYTNEGFRKSLSNKIINYNLYSDILDQRDIERTCNPHRLTGLNAPAKMQNYPISNPKIDLLVGESIKRRFDWTVRVINDDAISRKEEELKAKFSEMLNRHLQGGVSEEQVQKDLKNFERFRKYEYQDLRERRATQILKHLYHKQRLDYKFSKGFKDALLVAEEIYQVDIIQGEPVVERLNPKNVFTIRSGESTFIEDSDVIVVIGYHSPGSIIDDYHDELNESEISMIEERYITERGEKLGIDIGYKPDIQLRLDEELLRTMDTNGIDYSAPYDEDGNIRVTKVYWKSMRKLLKVKYYDEFGDEQYELYDENYKVDITKGEEAEVLWVNEWWEGHKIGGGLGSTEGALYKRMKPKDVQYRSMENPSKCHPGIVGSIYNTNDNEAVSLMDRMKPYQYLYNILAYNTELMIAKNKGKIMRLGLHEIPEDWKIDQWLSFAESMNIAIYDGFKEANKGVATGKIAGQLNSQQPIIDMEMGNSIQLYMQMMNFIKQEMGEIAGVSNARQAQISTREAVSNVEREISQSSHITEYWFQEHDEVKIRVLECLLETAKFAWKDKKNKKIQFVLDDGSTEIFEIDGEQFNEVDYDLAITDGGNSAELRQAMKQLAHAALQNQIINFTQLMDIYSTDSLSSIRRKIQTFEEDKMVQAQQAEQQKAKMQEQQLQAAAQQEAENRNFEREKLDREDARNAENNQTKILIEQMKIGNTSETEDADVDDNGVADRISLEKLKMDADKLSKDYQLKTKALDETIRHNKVTEGQKDKDLQIKKTKPKTSSK